MSAPAPSFDRTPADPLVSCMECETIVHVHCYPAAKKDRRWLCDLCSVQLVESSCVLCGQTSECGILQRVSDAEYARIHPTGAAAHAAMKAAPAHFAHTFCLSLYRSSPSRPAPCRLCLGESARLSCEICTLSHHPFCALRSPATLQLTASGNILCYCDRHLKTNATAALTPPVLPLMPLPQLTRPPPPAATIAMPPGGPADTSAAAAASAAGATTAAPARSPSVKREAKNSPSAAAATTATPVVSTAAALSVTAPAAPVASVASVRPVANIAAPIAAVRPAAPAAVTTAIAPSASPSASPSVSPTANGLSKKEQFAARLKASSPAASAAAAAPSNGRDGTPTPAKPADKRATAGAAATATAKPASKSAAGASKPAASSKAAAASAAAAVAASAKPAKPASSSPAKAAKSAKPARGNGKTAPAAAAAAAAASSRFTSHPSLRSSASSSSDDEDEGEAEWTGTDVPSAEHDKKLIQKALNQIKEIHEESKEIDEENCRVCGEDWAQDATDEEGNPTNDEMVGCDGCDGYYHQSCYGIDVVPTGDYYCWPCKAGRKKGEVQCVICKGKEWRGFCEVKYDSKADRTVFKEARKRKHFAHTACVLWSADTWFGDIDHRNPACGVENIPAAAFKLKCVKCSRLDGAKLQCSYKECVQAFHVLCMLNHPDEFFFDAHEEAAVATPKEYFCAHHSKRIRRERERERLKEAGESTAEIDAEIEAETPSVVPTTALLPAAKLVAVVPLKQGGRKVVQLEVDPEDQETRAKEFEEAAVKAKLKREEVEEDGESVSGDSSGDDSSRRSSAKAAKAKAKASKRKVHSIDADVESVDSDSSGESRGSSTKRRRLRKGTAADSQPRMKLELSGGGQSGAAAAASSSSSSLAADDLEISSSSNAQIDTRRAIRNQLLRLVDAGLVNRIEAGVYESCGRSTSDRYKQRATNLHYNLSHNAALLKSVQDGDVTVDQLLAMDTSQLATEEQKRTRAAEQADTIRDKTAAPHAVLLTAAGERVAIDPSTGKRINTNNK